MSIKKIIATPDEKIAMAAHKGDDIGVLLFGQGSPALPGLGRHLQSQFTKGLPGAPSEKAWDFLSLALAIFAADRFVLRANSEDGWTRVFDLDVAVIDPETWNREAESISAALRFLTGDIWHLKFSPSGAHPPKFQGKLHDRTTVCLFSGGLDSLLGALSLIDNGERPLLVSQGSPKEVGPQKYLSTQIGEEKNRFEAKVIEKWEPSYEPSTRGRSIIFFAYGIAAASALGLSEVIVPENGFIAINPPLTPRRRGSLSTRTVHPHFLDKLNEILNSVGLNIKIKNIFEDKTKGEVLSQCSHPKKDMLVRNSYSCGKGKRLNQQCGRCVPCLIRRSSFQAAKITDATAKGYKYSNLATFSDHDDVVAARLAAAKVKMLNAREFERWVRTAGPLPDDPQRRKGILRAVRAGIDELDGFLSGVKWR